MKKGTLLLILGLTLFAGGIMARNEPEKEQVEVSVVSDCLIQGAAVMQRAMMIAFDSPVPVQQQCFTNSVYDVMRRMVLQGYLAFQGISFTVIEIQYCTDCPTSEWCVTWTPIYAPQD